MDGTVGAIMLLSNELLSNIDDFNISNTRNYYTNEY